MFRFTLLASCVWLSCAPPNPVPDAGEPETPELVRVRAATFNTERFFDTVCQSGSCASGDYEELPTQAVFDARVVQVATAMNGFGADLISLQEIETQAVIDALLPRMTNSTPYAVLGEIGGTATVDVAVFSRWPIDKVVKHRSEVLTLPNGTRTTFSREFLEVHVTTVEGRRVIFFSAHFRSKNNDDPARRLAEAQASRRIIDAVAQQNQDALVILGGDLNDTPGSEPIEALELNGLQRAAADLPVADQGTYVYAGQSQAIDHLFQAVTPAAALVPRSARVWKEGARGFAGSDHRALTAEWEFEP